MSHYSSPRGVPWWRPGQPIWGDCRKRGRQLRRRVRLGQDFKKPLLDLLVSLKMSASSSKPQDFKSTNIFQTSAQRLRFREVK